MAQDSTPKAPAILRVRDLGSAKACLTVCQKAREARLLDLSNLGFLDPATVVLLYHFAFRARGGSMMYLPPRGRAAREYIDLHVQGVLTEKDSKRRRQDSSYPRRFIEDERAVVKELGEWREQIMHHGALSHEKARELSSTLSEVLVNSFVHGEPDRPCIIAGQIFRKQKHAMIAAADFGKTIPTSLKASKRYGVETGADHEWLAMSIKRGVTARTRESNRGVGLWMLTEQVRAAKGTLILISGRGALLLSDDGLKTQELDDRYETFPGTFLVIDLPQDG